MINHVFDEGHAVCDRALLDNDHINSSKIHQMFLLNAMLYTYVLYATVVC